MNRAQRNKAARLARRVLVDGRLMAPLPEEKHGLASTSRNWGCQCAPCVEANTQARRDYYHAYEAKERRPVVPRIGSKKIDHGTRAAYRHCRKANQGTACEPCRKAEAEYKTQWRLKDPERARQKEARIAARRRAMRRLAKLHPQEFQALLADELSQDEQGPVAA